MGRQRTYQAVTWDQAEMLRLATLRGCSELVGVSPSTLRDWAAAGRIHPVGQAPGGAFLYHVPTVISAHQWAQDRNQKEDPT